MSYRRPESVLVVVYTQAMECLLLERVSPPDFWQSITGALEWGEAPVDAAIRELAEETGLGHAGLHDAGVQRSFPILPEWRTKYAPEVDSNVEHCWYLQLPARGPVKLNPDEHKTHAWLPLETAITKVSSWSNREALEALRP